MMLRHTLLPALCALLGVLTGPVWGQDAQIAQDAHFKQERTVIDKRLAVEEAACYQKFVVNACLRSARQQARKSRTEVQQRENAAKEQARRERSEKHRQDLQGKQESVAEKAAQRGEQVGTNPSPARRSSQSAPNAPHAAADPHSAAQAAQRRTEDAAQARQKLLDKQRDAAEHVQALQRHQAQRAAQGHPLAAPLPDPP